VLQNLRHSLKGRFKYEQIYSALKISRQHYFQQQKNDNFYKDRDSRIIEIVKTWRINHPKMGSRSMYFSMKQCDIDLGIGVTKFEKLISENDLTVGKIKRYFPKTTDSRFSNKGYPNLTNGLVINNINQLIVADITYFHFANNWHYLFIFKDVYSQRILSIIPSLNMESANCLEAIGEIVELRGESSLEDCILHTDNGSQFDAKLFVKTLVIDLKMQISRSKESWQNGSAEQLNHVVKNMYLSNWKIPNFKQFCHACLRMKTFNNHQRAIEQLGYLTPVNFEKQIQTIAIEKRKQKIMYDFTKQTK